MTIEGLRLLFCCERNSQAGILIRHVDSERLLLIPPPRRAWPSARDVFAPLRRLIRFRFHSSPPFGFRVSQNRRSSARWFLGQTIAQLLVRGTALPRRNKAYSPQLNGIVLLIDEEVDCPTILASTSIAAQPPAGTKKLAKNPSGPTVPNSAR